MILHASTCMNHVSYDVKCVLLNKSIHCIRADFIHSLYPRIVTTFREGLGLLAWRKAVLPIWGGAALPQNLPWIAIENAGDALWCSKFWCYFYEVSQLWSKAKPIVCVYPRLIDRATWCTSFEQDAFDSRQVSWQIQHDLNFDKLFGNDSCYTWYIYNHLHIYVYAWSFIYDYFWIS